MKNLKMLLIALPISLLLMSSCKKKIYGCMDNTALNYSAVATEDAGSCVYEKPDQVIPDAPDEVKTQTIDNVAWVLSGNSYKISLSWSEITQNVIDNGTVEAYFRVTGTNPWHPLPVTFYLSSSYSTTIEVAYSLGNVTLYWSDSDLTQPDTPGNIDVKLVRFQ